MSSRQLRKLKGKKEQLELEEEYSSEEISSPKPKSKFSFVLLDTNDNSDFDSLENDSEPSATALPPSLPHPTTPKKQKKKKRNPTSDDIDAALRELNEKFGDWDTAAKTSNTASLKPKIQSIKFSDMMAVDRRYLDADAEMMRMFGARVVKEEIRRKNYAKTVRKTVLATPRDTWPRMESLGL
ncbi:Transcription factor 25, partial [Nowakowskiella sp. JEL0078]